MSEDREFKDLTVKELHAVADMFAVDLEGKTKKADVVKEIEDNGVTWDMYLKMVEPDEEEESAPAPAATVQDDEPEEVAEPSQERTVLLKMTRRNWSYQVRGYYFTRDHPYALVTEDDADYLIEEDGGFQIASPKEAREYYGG